ncbi:phosphoribosylglycinamide formyltransferase 2 [Methyloglobulus morosus KoM1]|uniref:Formate-dependent phosphoribosylglycinamide formyltransferase n=1 Tax=Methyloglobulus morosus KoM1 TaxID=1116472 RepID=V5E0S1_9GAMM|nr:formate-dependent phosphoribosylglycinamide formyltransferase [Methyloglobulus morosus]ESS73151.1 phosphoribosylglycinamide formyltransferase 2 [Methyloglobulus morosus KoM1]
MKLGSALTHSATKAMLLGSGELGKEITICLQRYGVEVIAVDRYPNAPAQQIAHRCHVITMTDAEELRKIIDLEMPDIIIPEIEAIATNVLAEIEANGLCRVIPNARAIQLTMNREGIRTLVAETLQIPTSKYAFAENYGQLKKAVDDGIGYPCFVKPTMSSSGKGQTRVKKPEQLEEAWNYARFSGRVDTGKVIVESKVDFDFEITLLTIRALDVTGQIQTYFCEPIGHVQENGDYRESWQPQAMTQSALQTAQEIAKKVTDALGGVGLFGVELFIQGDNVWFCELSPRPHDTGMVTMVTQRQNEFELHVRAILGLPIDPSLQKHGASAVILSDIKSKEFYYTGLNQALSVPDSEIRLFGKPEALVNRRMGVALASAETVEKARNRATKAAALMGIHSE